MKTFSQKPAEVVKKWVLIDAEGLVVGRLASIVANRLRGKHKPTYTPHVDDGDNVIIINADKVVLHRQEVHRQDVLLAHRPSRRHQGAHRSPDASKAASRSASLEKAVERMIPRGPLGRRQMKNLRVYAGSEHPHDAQQPEVARRRRAEQQEQEGS